MHRVAILIDAQNVSAKHWTLIHRRATSLGRVSACRVFGTFINGNKKWRAIAEKEALVPVMQFAGTNACDIAMTISAMELLHTGRTDIICLVSSDIDFLPLVQHLRHEGIDVYCFGEAKTPALLRKACNEFIELGELKAVATATRNAA
jgi:uncharacterized protein (TIGR00288 family)